VLETPGGAVAAAREEQMTRCPECESDLELDGYDLDVGETINCPECSTELRVVGSDPVSVALPEEEEG
jgi:alpha-aminoadipate carrier protein LysW